MTGAMKALLRARDAWEKAGRPGAQEQLSLFVASRFRAPEVVRGRLADRPRRKLR